MVHKFNTIEKIDKDLVRKIKKLKGPIVIFGAGGFIGVNLLQKILVIRSDVFGISRNSRKNWRFAYAKLPKRNLIDCDILGEDQIKKILQKIKPQTIFNLAAYGAYAKQSDFKKIYETNFISTVIILELLKKQKFSAYVHAGSQSEYGLNASAPKENTELVPNSHYAVSKVSDYFLLKYYGKVETLPVVHLRLYSAYGPWEEPDRLIPVLLVRARHGSLPPFVNPSISRDFVYVDDVVRAFIFAAVKMNKKNYGEVFNIATGKQTTIKDLAELTKRMFKIRQSPQYGTMKNRSWDLMKWYGDSKKIQNTLGWKPQWELRDGLFFTSGWQEEINYDSLKLT